MKKSVYTLLAALFFLCLIPRLIHAEEAIPLFLNGKALVSDVPAQNINGTAMVPIRIISETLGAVVGWNDEEKKVSVTKDKLNIVMQLGQKAVVFNETQAELTEAPVNVDGSALLPLRFLAEALGLKVTWNQEERAVYLTRLVIERPVVVVEQPAVDTELNPDGHDHGEEAEELPAAAEPATIIESILSEYDQVTVRANGDLHPTMFYLSSPDRLVIDFEQSILGEELVSTNKPTINSTINTIMDSSNIVSSEEDSSPPADVNYAAATNGFSVSSSVYIDKVRYANFSDKPATVRVVIDLKQKNSYELIEDKENNVVIIMQKAPSTYTVVLDAGHGGKDSGAISGNKLYERDFNLAMVLKVQELLAQEPMINVVMTRSDNTFVELNDRAAIANNLGAQLFISIHGNSYAKTSSGTETYYYRNESLDFAKIMHPKIVAATGFPDKKVRKEKFRVVAATQMPAILLEIGYLSNPKEVSEMFKEEFQNRVAISIVAGIKEYLHIV